MKIDGLKTEKVTIEVDSTIIVNDLYRAWKNSVIQERAYECESVLDVC